MFFRELDLIRYGFKLFLRNLFFFILIVDGCFFFMGFDFKFNEVEIFKFLKYDVVVYFK